MLSPYYRRNRKVREVKIIKRRRKKEYSFESSNSIDDYKGLFENIFLVFVKRVNKSRKIL